MGGGFRLAVRRHPALASPAGHATIPPMSKLATTDPKELRPLLHERIDQCSPEELEAVRKTLLQFELNRLMDSVGEAIDDAAARGEMTPEKIETDIREHRARHPYR